MTSLVLFVTIDVHADDIAAMTELARTMVAATRQEPGCVRYAFGHDIEHPGRFLLSEAWHDRAALDAHFATEHMATFRAGVRALRVVSRVAIAYDVHGESDPLA
jgi:quinol monooxygenase YgiN